MVDTVKRFGDVQSDNNGAVGRFGTMDARGDMADQRKKSRGCRVVATKTVLVVGEVEGVIEIWKD